MKRLDPTEKGAVLLASLFIVFGLYTAIYPKEMLVSHPGSGRYQSLIGHDPPPEHVSREKARIYGIIALVFGMGMGWLVFYRPGK